MALDALVLADVLRLPMGLLLAAGLILLPYATFVASLGTRDRLQASTLWALIACTVLWVIECTFVAFSRWVEASTVATSSF